MAQRATITQVAQRAGVSIASASRALNGLTSATATVEAVRAAARELGYIPDATARSLKLGRTLQLAYAVADIGNPVYVEMMAAIQEVVSGAGYRLLVTNTGDAAGTVDLVTSLQRGYADGMVLSPLRVTDELVAAVAQSPVPVVVLGRMPESAGVDTVAPDSAGGIALAVAHLHAIGARRIAFVNGPADTIPGRVRGGAFVAAAGPDAPVVSAADFTAAAGHAVAHALLSGPDRPDAVLAANDLLAIGVLHAADQLGLSTPDQLAVVGVDDTELGKLFRPALTSVDLGASERGRRAAELLLERLNDPHKKPQQVVVPAALSVRRSSDVKGEPMADDARAPHQQDQEGER
ncbi:LacI family DNA-binding transcriptional regulator [Pseudactinotalea suaedae]|uniref:LacI family DNA-binding transcriptional regulator n=1 Tax=Pseudactinotalea suaedae TaxID=1524924 RepID=UPI0012E14176|nr:LacI family DNA-binding transcriptional regulator [Pseudactinotalea suaedae]